MGLVDGMLLAPFFGARPANMSRLHACVVGMDDEQLTAILSEHLKAHPEQWHQSVHVMLFTALSERCPR
jgi:hypothetical protein